MIEEEKERKFKPQKRIKANPEKIYVKTPSGLLPLEEKQEIIKELNDLLELAEQRLDEAIKLKGDSESLRYTGYNAFFAMARENVFKKRGIPSDNNFLLGVVFADVLYNVMGLSKD